MAPVYFEDAKKEYRYIPTEGGIKIVGYSGVKDNVRIPETIDGNTVVEIGINEEGYVGDMNFNIYIPRTVRHIDVNAINGPQSSRRWRVYRKGWFTDFELEEGNPYLSIDRGMLIENGDTVVFCKDSDIKNIVIPENIHTIGKYAFRDCQDLEDVILPSGIQVIEDYAFDGCNISYISLPEGLKKIGYSAFHKRSRNYNDRAKLELLIPSTLTSLAANFGVELKGLDNNKNFVVCDGLLLSADKKVVLWYLGDATTEIAVPDYIEEISSYAYSVPGLTNVKKITFGSSLVCIRRNAFSENKVKTLRIPEQLVHIEDAAFDYSSVTSIMVDKKNKGFYTDKIALYRIEDDGSYTLIYCFRPKVEEYSVVEKTVRINEGAFVDCELLQSLKLPDTLLAFSEKSVSPVLKSITIPAFVKEIEFNLDSKLIYNIDPHNTVYFWDNHILYKNTDAGLLAVRYDGKTTVIEFKEGTFSVAPWAVTQNVSKVIFPESMRRVEHHAFYGCGLSSIELNEGLEFIDYVSFARNKITEVRIPATVNYVCTSAFYYCPLAQYSVADESNSYVASDDALYSKDMSILYDVPVRKESDSFVVAPTTRDICRAFRGCGKIKSITLPDQLKNIWMMSIVGCKTLKDVYFGNVVDYINTSCIDYDFTIALHAELDSAVAQMLEVLRAETNGRTQLTLAVKGMEDIQKLSKDFVLMPNSTGLTIIKNKSKKKNIVIPTEIKGHLITAIDAYAFSENSWGNETIESVEIPDTVLSIGAGAFHSCRKLKQITLSSGMTTISRNMFAYCEQLETVIIPEGVTCIEDGAFFGCKSLQKLVFPSSLVSISEWLFTDCDRDERQYRDLYLNSKTLYVVEKGSYAEQFLRAYKPDKYDCDRLSVIYSSQLNAPVSEEETAALEYLDYSVLEDGTVSVSYKKYLQNEPLVMNIPSTIQGMPVTKLTGMGSISSSLKKIIIPASVKEIEGLYYLSFYSGGQNMEAIEVAEENQHYWSDGHALYTKDKSVLIHMFDYQASEYTICKGTKIIGKESFGKFSNLKRLVLPDGLQEIQQSAFYDCGNLAEIIGVESVPMIAEGVLGSTAYYRSCSVIISGTVLQKYNVSTERQYEIPYGITEISRGAFSTSDENDQLEAIIIPDTVRTIGSSAFSGRRKLKSVIIPEGVTKIESGTFSGCESIESIYIPASISEIAQGAFPVYQKPWRGAPIIPACSEFIVAESNQQFCSFEGILYSKDKTRLIEIPANYKYEQFDVPNTVVTIGSNAFKGNQHIKKIILPDTVTTIESNAFAECVNLEEINLDKVVGLGHSAFSGCEKLRSIVLTATEIGAYAFSKCTKLAKVSLVGTETIGSSAFNECRALKELILPEGLSEIGDRAFAECGLKTIVVPKTVLKTGNESFSGCQEITIYDSIDPDAKPCEEYLDDVNGHPNSVVGFIGIGRAWAMWQCAANHKWVDHEIVVRSAETDEIKYKVWMGSDPKQRMYYCTLTSSWGKNASFNFIAMDNAFAGIKGISNKIKVAINRLKYPVMLSEGQKNAYVTYLVRSAKDLVKMCIDNDDMELLLFCEPFGVIKKNNIDDLLEYSAKKKATQFSAYLIEYKSVNFGGGKTRKAPTLSFKPIELWTTSKSAPSKVGRYKGTDTEVVFPTEVKGVTITGVAGTTSKVPDNYRAITRVVLPEGYTSIGDYAFYGCENLESIVLPSTLQTIGKDAFNGCRKLKELIMPDSLTDLSDNSFRNCSSLVNVRFSKKLKSIPGYAFYGCSSLKEIELPASVNRIYKGCFEIYGLKKLVVHCESMWSTGQCFGNAPEVHAYKDAMKGVYGITQRTIHNMKIVDNPSKTFVTLQIEVDSSSAVFNFFIEETIQSIQKADLDSISSRLNKICAGSDLHEIISMVYGADILQAENNAEEAEKLKAYVIEGKLTSICINEEKHNDDGEVTSRYEFSVANHRGTLKEKEIVGHPKASDSDGGYFSYYDYYVPFEEESAEAEQEDVDAGFVDITDGDEAVSGFWNFDAIDSIEFEGKNFVLTGFGASEEATITNAIVSRGGVIKSSVVLKTDYVVVMEDYDHKTSKYLKAKELQEKGKTIAVISSKQFYKLLETE